MGDPGDFGIRTVLWEAREPGRKLGGREVRGRRV